MKKLLLIFLAFGMLFANTPQQALDSYYTSFMLEYNVDSYTISGLECLEDGDDALCEYKLHAEISGAETFSYDLDYLSLLHKVNGEWKISFAMPLDEYLETREEQEQFAMLEEMLDEEDELYSKEPMDGPGQVTFDGVPMSDMSSELDDMLYSCTSNEYCQQNGYGNSCSNGKCSDLTDDGWEDVSSEDDDWEDVGWDEVTEPEQESCPLSFGLLLLPLMLALKRRN